MTALESIKAWLAEDASPEERAEIVERLRPSGGALAALNAVTVSGAQMREAVSAIQHVQVRSEADAIEHGRLLSIYSAEAGIGPVAYAGPALHARAIAMDRWCHRYDPFGQTNVDAFFEAAARAPIIETNEGMAFEPVRFRELIDFIAELPF